MMTTASQENPFAPPSQESLAQDRLLTPDPRDFIVHGNIVICGELLVLPHVCWKSGMRDELERVHFRIQPASFRLGAVPIQIVGYISQHQKRRDRRRRLRLTALMLAGVLMIAIPSQMTSGGARFSAFVIAPLVVAGIAVCVASLAKLLYDQPVVLRHRVPRQYRIRGFSPALLQHLQRIQTERSGAQSN